ncbi:MAG: hypothetical protein CVT92_07405 [Bacteroidetes bacterium HGW-Bacteroidetes-1]|jgi:hypothetical protein|nr:MAG: hypothetical protein CVT92_07405 [Bacteroidetes bacterium HGW-Bacteroidetes-1]
MYFKRLLPVLLVAFAFSGCDPSPDPNRGEVVAKVYGNYLYESDLTGIVPSGTPIKDSLFLTNSYIDSWIRKRLLIRQAERNLTPRQQDFTRKLEDYRNSLLTYSYETELINQKLDTIVSDREIEVYYNQNKSSFQLRYNIVKVVYVVLPENSKEISTFIKLLTNPDTIISQAIESLAKRYATSFYIGDETWIRFDDLLAQIPIETYNQELFLRNNKFIEIDDAPFKYLIRFKDFIISESVSPLEIETENIRNIIINKRKQELLRKMYEELYEQAIRDNVFEIY